MNNGYHVYGIAIVEEPQVFNEWLRTINPDLQGPLSGEEIIEISKQENREFFGFGSNWFYAPTRLSAKTFVLEADKFYYPLFACGPDDLLDYKIDHMDTTSKSSAKIRLTLPEDTAKIVEAMELGYHGCLPTELNYMRVYYKD